MERQPKHLDEAREGAVETMNRIVRDEPAVTAAAIVDDLFGRVSACLWVDASARTKELVAAVQSELATACAQYWSGDVAVSKAPHPDLEEDILRRATWQEGTAIDGTDRVRLN